MGVRFFTGGCGEGGWVALENYQHTSTRQLTGPLTRPDVPKAQWRIPTRCVQRVGTKMKLWGKGAGGSLSYSPRPENRGL